jgi:hypothetical protein
MKCIVCGFSGLMLTTYKTKHGRVCEDCFESREGEASDYQEHVKNKEGNKK